MAGRIPIGLLILLSFMTACKDPENREIRNQTTRKVALETKVPAADKGWRESLRFPIRMTWARGVAVTETGQIAVVGDRHLLRYSPTGNLECKTELEGIPAAVVAGVDGNLLVAFDNHVEVLGEDDLPVAIWDSVGESALFSGIAVTKDTVFVADAGNRTVHRFGADGARTGELDYSSTAGSDLELVVPSRYLDVVVGPGGLVLVSNPGRHRIEAHAGGRKAFEWGRPGSEPEAFPGCCNPIALAVLPDGDVVTAQKGKVRIKQYGIEGDFKAEIAGPEDYAGQLLACSQKGLKSVDSGLDLAVDRAGNVYALEPCVGEIRIYKAPRRKPGGPDTGCDQVVE
jgi:hypothetical protein